MSACWSHCLACAHRMGRAAKGQQGWVGSAGGCMLLREGFYLRLLPSQGDGRRQMATLAHHLLPETRSPKPTAWSKAAPVGGSGAPTRPRRGRGPAAGDGRTPGTPPGLGIQLQVAWPWPELTGHGAPGGGGGDRGGSSPSASMPPIVRQELAPAPTGERLSSSPAAAGAAEGVGWGPAVPASLRPPSPDPDPPRL